jgi:tetratricopeptide (TPR) repeat protein
MRWERVHVEEFSPAQALEQLTEELGRSPRNREDLGQWQRLFVRCGHLPLAIHLCAGALRTRTVDEILERLLELAPRDDADPVSGLRAAFELSWGLFANHVQRPQPVAQEDDPAWTGALGAFSAAPLTGVGRKLGAAVCGLDLPGYHAVMEAASSLSLVVRDEAAPQEQDAPRYRCHTLIREFAEGKDPDTARHGYERMSQWFLERLPETADLEVQTARWLETSVEEEALAAWLDALDAEQAQGAVMAGNLYARRHGPWRAWRAAAEKGTEVPEPFEAWASSAFVAADVSRNLGDLDASLRCATVLRDRARSAGAERMAALGTGQIADILQARGDLDEALRIRREEELPVYEKLGDIRSRAVTMGQIADILQARGDLDEALRIRREEQLPVYEKLGDIRERAVTILKIALVEAGQGKPAEADRIFETECIPVFERLGARVDLAMARFLHAQIKAALGRDGEARALAVRALDDAEKLGLPVAANIREFLGGPE